MNMHQLLVAGLSFAALLVAVPAGRGQGPDTPPNPENIEATLRLTLAAAAEYDIRVGDDDKPLDLIREPVLKWSNPDRGEVHGNVFLWTRGGRPMVVGSLYKWFTRYSHMAHEFHSLTPLPLSAKFHGDPVWKATEAGLKFEDLPGAPAPAVTGAQRLLQMKQLAKDYSGTKKERDGTGEVELRLLPQPIYRYAVPKEGILTGGLFALVHGTDPEIFLLLEARVKDGGGSKWQYAITRMTSSGLRLRRHDKEVWAVGSLTTKQAVDHEVPYTTFYFNEVPEFLKDALAKPKP